MARKRQTTWPFIIFAKFLVFGDDHRRQPAYVPRIHFPIIPGAGMTEHF
jgi:hypothetical protein